MPAPTAPTRVGPRTEWKFVLDPSRTRQVFEFARGRMGPDPHYADQANSTYFVESIYFDTPTLQCYVHDGDHPLPKYRLRRYGAGTVRVFLEEKLRRRDSVWKRRIASDQSESDALMSRRDPICGEVAWYRSKIGMLRLRPTLLVTYQRRALQADDGARLTIDSEVSARALAPGDLSFDDPSNQRTVLVDHILELKFTGRTPSVIREVLATIGRKPAACSKYRLGMRSFGAESWSSRRA